MSNEHTPHIEEVCSAYVQYHHFNSYGMDDSEETEKSFYRMIAQVEAAAEQRGAAKGWDRGFYESQHHDHVWEEDPPNPYRADRLEGENA